MFNVMSDIALSAPFGSDAVLLLFVADVLFAAAVAAAVAAVGIAGVIEYECECERRREVKRVREKFKDR